MTDHALGRAVLAQAFKDACSPTPKGLPSLRGGSCDPRGDARNWLTSPNRGLAAICYLAETDIDLVVDTARQLADDGWPMPVIAEETGDERRFG